MLFLDKWFKCEIHQSRFYYYKLMKDYLDGKITPTEYSLKYNKQRHKDFDDWEKQGHTCEDT